MILSVVPRRSRRVPDSVDPEIRAKAFADNDLAKDAVMVGAVTSLRH
jgi:hypothetical protein